VEGFTRSNFFFVEVLGVVMGATTGTDSSLFSGIVSSGVLSIIFIFFFDFVEVGIFIEAGAIDDGGIDDGGIEAGVDFSSSVGGGGGTGSFSGMGFLTGSIGS